jgi:hypothetical protein
MVLPWRHDEDVALIPVNPGEVAAAQTIHRDTRVTNNPSRSMMANGSLIEALSNAHASCFIQKHHEHVKDETIKSDFAAIENGPVFGANQISTKGNSYPPYIHR